MGVVIVELLLIYHTSNKYIVFLSEQPFVDTGTSALSVNSKFSVLAYKGDSPVVLHAMINPKGLDDTAKT